MVIWLIIAALAMLPLTVSAQPISYTAPGQFFLETFDALPNSPENAALESPWIDDVTLPHWMAFTSLDAGAEGGHYRLRITHGNTGGGAIYSFGAASDTDRGLGSIGSTIVGDVYWGTRFRNNTGKVLTDLSFTFFGEQWRDGGATAPAISVAQRVDFQFSLNASGIFGSAFMTPIDVDALDFISPNFGSSNAVSFDGNLSVNHVLLSATVRSIQWLPNTDLFVRWIDINHAGNDHGLGIDDFAFVATVPEPTTGSFILLTVAVALRRRTCRSVSELEMADIAH